MEHSEVVVRESFIGEKILDYTRKNVGVEQYVAALVYEIFCVLYQVIQNNYGWIYPV